MDSNNSMLKTIESFGPQLFDIKGSISIWTTIIQSLDQTLINNLTTITEKMNSSEKYDFAKRILSLGFDQVINDFIQNNTHVNQSQYLETNQDIVNGSEGEESVQFDVILNSSDGSYVEAESEVFSLTSNKSYKTAFNSVPTQSQEIDQRLEDLHSSQTDTDQRLEDLNRSQTDISLSIVTGDDFDKTPKNTRQPNDSVSEKNSQSQPSDAWSEGVEPSSSGFSGTIVSLSSITSFYSQGAQTLSPTSSLTISSSFGISPKSSSLSPRSLRKCSPPKSPQKIIEEYKILVPYESYCSEKVYINDCSTDSNAILSTNLLENIIEENIKSIECTDLSED